MFFQCICGCVQYSQISNRARAVGKSVNIRVIPRSIGKFQRRSDFKFKITENVS